MALSPRVNQIVPGAIAGPYPQGDLTMSLFRRGPFRAAVLVTVPAVAALIAPAVAQAAPAAPVTVLSESFATGHLPAGWKVVNMTDGSVGSQPDGQGLWTFTDPDHIGNQTGGSGGFAGLDSVLASYGPVHASLVTPYLKKSANSVATVSFHTDMVSTNDVDYAYLQYSTDKGLNWTTVWSKSGITTIAPGTPVTVTLPSAVTSAKHFTLRWNSRQVYAYRLSKPGYVQIDDVTVTTN
jgi:hypothetical protein